MTHDTPIPSWLGRSAVLLLLVALLGIGLISAGLFDPKPVGPEIASLPVHSLDVPAGGSRQQWLDTPLPAGSYSLHLTAAHQTGETDIGYGLAVGNEEESAMVAVSPLGYVTIFRIPYSVSQSNTQYAIRNTPLLPWQPWPHVRPDTNEIWLDMIDGVMTVRVNREWLWQGQAAAGTQVGLWLESYGAAATVDFAELRLFAAPSDLR